MKESDWLKEQRDYLLKKVNKRCEACNFYAITQEDVLEHSKTSKHGFVNGKTIINVL